MMPYEDNVMWIWAGAAYMLVVYVCFRLWTIHLINQDEFLGALDEDKSEKTEDQ